MLRLKTVKIIKRACKLSVRRKIVHHRILVYSVRKFNNNNNNNNFKHNQNKSQNKTPNSNPNEKTKDVHQLHAENRVRTLEHIKDVASGTTPENPQHPHNPYEDYVLPHGIWTKEQIENIQITHLPPKALADYLAYFSVKLLRTLWDLSTGYTLGHNLKLIPFTKNQWLLRIAYLETVAGVPPMIFSMVRHLNSLRRMERDHGWIHSLLSEAENERIHLLTVLHIYQPSKWFRFLVLAAQGIVSNYLFLCYIISSRYCHRFVGYLEEEATKTYTILLDDIDKGKYPEFLEPCSDLARNYWRLPENAVWRDVFAQMKGDEAHHRDVNHILAPISNIPGAKNPFRLGEFDPKQREQIMQNSRNERN